MLLPFTFYTLHHKAFTNTQCIVATIHLSLVSLSNHCDRSWRRQYHPKLLIAADFSSLVKGGEFFSYLQIRPVAEGWNWPGEWTWKLPENHARQVFQWISVSSLIMFYCGMECVTKHHSYKYVRSLFAVIYSSSSLSSSESSSSLSWSQTITGSASPRMVARASSSTSSKVYSERPSSAHSRMASSLRPSSS